MTTNSDKLNAIVGSFPDLPDCSGPCLCGAPDCIKCFPSNFTHGRYIFRECEECGNDYIPEDEDDKVCEECAPAVKREHERAVESTQEYDKRWWNTWSAMGHNPGEDCEEHSHRITRIVWEAARKHYQEDAE